MYKEEEKNNVILPDGSFLKTPEIPDDSIAHIEKAKYYLD
jgi:hypothetical protein